MTSRTRTERIRALNDQFRATLVGGTVVITAGIAALGPDTQAAIIAAIKSFNAFDVDNDPWGEHDFGAVDVDNLKVYFKVDYYDLTRRYHSRDAADPTVTERVMTIMLASEY